MPSLENLSPGVFFPKLLETTVELSGDSWNEIKLFAKHELKILAVQIHEIGKAVLDGELSKKGAKMLFRMAKNNLISLLAGVSVMLLAAAQRLINAILKELKGYINNAIGFVLF